jgi:AAA family ATP:ADP antiporter
MAPSVLLPSWLLLGSILLLCAVSSIYLLMKKVPGYYMHGYEAVYQLEKQKKKQEKKKKESFLDFLKNSIEGLLLIITNPYVLGIFSLVIFYEVIVVIFDFRFLLAADAASTSACGLALSYASYYIIMNSIGLFFVVFGTTPILRILGIRATLFVFPIIIVGMLIVTLFFPYTTVFFWVLVLLRALNYAFNHPTKEVLYIPTPKNIKFKAKAWIDGFGSRISKGTGSIFNLAVKGGASQSLIIFTSILFSLGLATAWIVVVFFLGKVLQNAISNKKVIGEEEA